jgi:glycosyltransferase involved in cell wall biosynthesis
MSNAPQLGSSGPRVSIVVPAYNRQRHLGATVDSVLAQSFEEWELVIFDDGSVDETAEVAARYAAVDGRIRCLGGPNEGVASARNRGFAATDRRSEFVIFLDSDDVWEPDALETLIDALDADQAYVSAYGLARCIDDEGRQPPGDDLEMRMRERVAFRNHRLTALDPDEPTTFASLAYDNCVLTPGIHLVRRAVIERVGTFDPSTDPADDWDMAIRISRLGNIRFVPRHVIRWRRHNQTLSQTSPHWKQAYFRVRDKLLTDVDNTAEQTQLARLAYREMSRDVWDTGLEQLRRGRLPGAARHFAKAAEIYLRYVRAAVPMRFAR